MREPLQHPLSNFTLKIQFPLYLIWGGYLLFVSSGAVFLFSDERFPLEINTFRLKKSLLARLTQ